MICCVQRVDNASVNIEDQSEMSIGEGVVVFVGIEKGDTEKSCGWMADKVCGLRIFSDEQGKMGKSVIDIKGGIMLVSQFTLSASCKKGRRPDFGNAMDPLNAEILYNLFVEKCCEIAGRDNIVTGKFGADMKVSLQNNGPVTFLINDRD